MEIKNKTKIFFVLLFCIFYIVSFGQYEGVFYVTDSTKAFGRILPKGQLIVDRQTSNTWTITQSTTATTQSLQTTSYKTIVGGPTMTAGSTDTFNVVYGDGVNPFSASGYVSKGDNIYIDTSMVIRQDGNDAIYKEGDLIIDSVFKGLNIYLPTNPEFYSGARDEIKILAALAAEDVVKFSTTYTTGTDATITIPANKTLDFSNGGSLENFDTLTFNNTEIVNPDNHQIFKNNVVLIGSSNSIAKPEWFMVSSTSDIGAATNIALRKDPSTQKPIFKTVHFNANSYNISTGVVAPSDVSLRFDNNSVISVDMIDKTNSSVFTFTGKSFSLSGGNFIFNADSTYDASWFITIKPDNAYSGVDSLRVPYYINNLKIFGRQLDDAAGYGSINAIRVLDNGSGYYNFWGEINLYASNIDTGIYINTVGSGFTQSTYWNVIIDKVRNGIVMSGTSMGHIFDGYIQPGNKISAWFQDDGYKRGKAIYVGTGAKYNSFRIKSWDQAEPYYDTAVYVKGYPNYFPEQTLEDGLTGYTKAINLANSLKTNINAHFLDTDDHLIADPSVIDFTAPTTLETLKTAIDSLSKYYTLHNNDIKNAIPTYHQSQHNVTDFDLDYGSSPTTIAGCMVALNRIKYMYNRHALDHVTHDNLIGTGADTIMTDNYMYKVVTAGGTNLIIAEYLAQPRVGDIFKCKGIGVRVPSWDGITVLSESSNACITYDAIHPFIDASGRDWDITLRQNSFFYRNTYNGFIKPKITTEKFIFGTESYLAPTLSSTPLRTTSIYVNNILYTNSSTIGRSYITGATTGILSIQGENSIYFKDYSTGTLAILNSTNLYPYIASLELGRGSNPWYALYTSGITDNGTNVDIKTDLTIGTDKVTISPSTGNIATLGTIQGTTITATSAFALINGETFTNAVDGTIATSGDFDITGNDLVFGNDESIDNNTNGVIDINGILNTTSDITYGDTFWNDLVISATQAKQGNTSHPAFDYDSVALHFTDSGADTGIIYMNYQLPHNWKDESPVYFHIHWNQYSGTDSVRFLGEYRLLPLGIAGQNSWTSFATVDDKEYEYTSGILNQICAFSSIPTYTLRESSIIQIKAWHHTDPATDYNDDIYVTSFDLHYEMDKPGSDDSDPEAVTDYSPYDYFVSPYGNDANDGLTPLTAFLTINQAENTATDGDTVLVFPGTYNMGAKTFDQNVVWYGYGATLYNNAADTYFLTMSGNDTKKFYGFTIDKGGTKGTGCILLAGSQNNYFEDIIITSPGLVAFYSQTAGGANNNVTNSTITGGSGGSNCAIALSRSPITFTGCTLTVAEDYGFYRNGTAGNVTLTNNTMVVNAGTMIYSDIGGTWLVENNTITTGGTFASLIGGSNAAAANSQILKFYDNNVAFSHEPSGGAAMYFRNAADWDTVYIDGNTFSSTTALTKEIMELCVKDSCSVTNNTFTMLATAGDAAIKVLTATGIPQKINISGNNINAKTESGYNIAIGTETTSAANNTVTATISENYIVSGYYHNESATGQVHGIFVGFNKDIIVKHNYVWGAGIGVGYKHDGTNMGGYIAYNVIRDCEQGLRAKGSGSPKFYGNTVIITKSYVDNGIYCDQNTAGALSDTADIRNNIVYLGSGITNNIWIGIDAASDQGYTIDNNCVYGVSDNPYYSIGGTAYDGWTAIQGLGIEDKGINSDPLFEIDYYYLKEISPCFEAGYDLGATYETGLSRATVWTSSVVTATQPATWTIGAYVNTP